MLRTHCIKFIYTYIHKLHFITLENKTEEIFSYDAFAEINNTNTLKTKHTLTHGAAANKYKILLEGSRISVIEKPEKRDDTDSYSH